MEADDLLASVDGGGGTPSYRAVDNNLNIISTVAQKYKSIHSTTPNSSTLLSRSFTPLQNSFTRRPRFVHSTATFLHSTPPVSFTPLQYSFTRRPQIPSLHALQNSFTPRPQIPSLHCKIPSLHSTPCVTVISVPCLRRKSQLRSDGHSSDALRARISILMK